MLSPRQVILLKRAQADAGLNDADYREALQLVAGVQTSKDPRVTDVHLDRLLGYFEAIYWKNLDDNRRVRPSQVFRTRGHWARKNGAGHNSRDRFIVHLVKDDIAVLEAKLADLGFGPAYCRGIFESVVQDDRENPSAHSLSAYRHALSRTLACKTKEKLHAYPNRD